LTTALPQFTLPASNFSSSQRTFPFALAQALLPLENTGGKHDKNE